MGQSVVWITGASTGIGFEIARTFAKAGYIVAATARRKSRIVSLVNELRFTGCEAYAFVCDVQSERNVVSTKKKIIEKCGGIDILVNNAGVTVYKSFIDTKSWEFDYVLDTNLRGSFLATKAVLPLMIKRRRGHIINILSVAANTAFEESSVYSASKAALHAMANSLREEVRKFNIRISNILPGNTDTPMWDSKVRMKYKNRMMTPKDVAEVVLAVANQPRKVVIEDVIIRPIKGDL